MAFEDDNAKIQTIIERARRGDTELSDSEIIAAVDEFDAALSFRVNYERAAELLLLVAAPLCFFRPSISAQVMPIALWASMQMAYEDTSQMATALSGFADYASENELLETPVLDWLRGAARDEAELEKWLGTVQVWLVQSQTDA